MTIYDLVYLFADACLTEMEIYDLHKGETVYRGTADEIPDELEYMEISSIDAICEGADHITVNIDTLES